MEGESVHNDAGKERGEIAGDYELRVIMAASHILKKNRTHDQTSEYQSMTQHNGWGMYMPFTMYEPAVVHNEASGST